MSGHTKVNLLEVEDSAPKFGMPEGMAARFAHGDLGLETLGISHFKLAPDAGPPFGHRHPGGPEADEVYVCISGSARMKVGDDVVELGERDALRVPGNAWRCLRGGPDGAEVVAFGARSKESELEQGWWTE